MSSLCPVCGFNLGLPWTGDSPSGEICPSCGIQFGYDDSRGDLREGIYSEWRQRWIANGMRWSSAQAVPLGWSPSEQLRELENPTARPTAHELADRVEDEPTFLEFVGALRRERAQQRREWQNDTIEHFLESAEAWAHDSHFGERVGIPKTASPWRKLAAFLYAGKIYE